MNTQIRLAGFALLLAIGAACDNTTPEQRTVQAQDHKDDKVASAARDADARVANAEADGQKEVVNAEANAATSREQYRHKLADQLVELDRKIGLIDAKLPTTTGAEHDKLAADLKNIRAQRDAFDVDWKRADKDTDAAWDANRARLDKEYADLSAAVDRSS